MNYVEFGGGLGDVFTLVWQTARYTSLEKISEPTHVILNTHNPHANELFTLHRQRENLIVHDHGFWWPKDDETYRKKFNLPPKQPIAFERQDRVIFYPADSDWKVLREAVKPYIAVSIAAGGADRNVPEPIWKDMERVLGSMEYRVLALGRNYQVRMVDGSHHRQEVKIKSRNNVTSAIDLLSVPGTLQAIENSVGVVSAHSAMCLAAWYMKKPVFLLYPDHAKEMFSVPPHQYTIGKDNPDTVCLPFSEYSRDRFAGFLSMLTREESKNPSPAGNR